MLKLAFYGKGGIGKSTICNNLAIALRRLDFKVMQIGCDPKADSTISLHPTELITPALELLRSNPKIPFTSLIHKGEEGVYCLEVGGPTPGLGCAGRGIAMVLEYLEKEEVYQKLELDFVLFDVLGDVVCGGFAMPMRKGLADKVIIVTSTERMSILACHNIAEAVRNFKGRGYASLAGLIVNHNLEDLSLDSVRKGEDDLDYICEEFETTILGRIPEDPLFREADNLEQPLLSLYFDCKPAECFKELAKKLVELN